MVDSIEDPRRIDPPHVAPERSMLESWLEFHRVTLLLKCDGLDAGDLRARPVPTSLLSLGLVRHMAEVERNWFARVLAGEDAPPLFYDEANPEGDLEIPDDADFADDLALWQTQCDRARETAAARSLDDTGIRRGEAVSLRWIYVHMVEEYARHNGHADLIRELIDGSVGD